MANNPMANKKPSSEASACACVCVSLSPAPTQARARLKLQMPPLWMSNARKEVGGSPSATHSSARRMDLCVTIRCVLPGASSTSARAAQRVQ